MALKSTKGSKPTKKVAGPAPSGLGLCVDGKTINTVEELNDYIHGIYYTNQIGTFTKA